MTVLSHHVYQCKLTCRKGPSEMYVQDSGMYSMSTRNNNGITCFVCKRVANGSYNAALSRTPTAQARFSQLNHGTTAVRFCPDYNSRHGDLHEVIRKSLQLILPLLIPCSPGLVLYSHFWRTEVVKQRSKFHEQRLLKIGLGLEWKIEEERVIGTAAGDDDVDGRALLLLLGAEERDVVLKLADVTRADILGVFTQETPDRNRQKRSTQDVLSWVQIRWVQISGERWRRTKVNHQCITGTGAAARYNERRMPCASTDAQIVLHLNDVSTVLRCRQTSDARHRTARQRGGSQCNTASEQTDHSFAPYTRTTPYLNVVMGDATTEVHLNDLVTEAFLGDSAHPDAHVPPDENRSRVRPDSLLIAVRIRHPDLILT
nr:hypothetical protein CFP56_13481 [Quercus suber]